MLGILSYVCCGIFTAIAAIITGHMARGRVKESLGALSGGGLAMAGLILGYLNVVLTVLALVLLVPQLPPLIAQARTLEAMSREQDIGRAITAAGIWPADSGLSSTGELLTALEEKDAVTPAGAAQFRIHDFLIGNVAADDPPETIVIRTKPGLFSSGHVVVLLKNGDAQVVRTESEIPGTPPPRDPPYLGE